MATLVREKVSSTRPSAIAIAAEDDELRSNVPAPFPKDLAQELLDELAAEDVGLDSISVNAEPSTSRAPARLTIQVSGDDSAVNVWFTCGLSHHAHCLTSPSNRKLGHH